MLENNENFGFNSRANITEGTVFCPSPPARHRYRSSPP
jgi:hypothetical protein